MKKPKPPAPPTEPPKLVDMAARKYLLETERILLFPQWKAALEASSGNVTVASLAFFPELLPADKKDTRARDKGNRLTRRLGLTVYARELRFRKTGHGRGRQDR